jgi:hypothetical protein
MLESPRDWRMPSPSFIIAPFVLVLASIAAGQEGPAVATPQAAAECIRVLASPLRSTARRG